MTEIEKTPFRMWLDALRSGEFQQGRGKLRMGEEFCCLGVACEIAVQNGVIPPFDDEVNGYDGATSFLPSEVATWLKMPDHDPVISDANGMRVWVTLLNDDQQASFPEIADLLEAEFPHLL